MTISTSVKNKVFCVWFNNRIDCNLYIINSDNNIVCFWLIQSQSNSWLSSAKSIKEDTNVTGILFLEHFFKLIPSSVCDFQSSCFLSNFLILSFLLSRFSKTLNAIADFISDTLEKCPFFFIRSFCPCRVIKSPMNSFYIWRSYWAVICCMSA